MKKNKTRQGSSELKKFCVFTVGGRDFLLPADEVTAILDIAKIFPVPGAPDYVYSALPRHGRIVTAIDLTAVFQIEQDEFLPLKLVVVTEQGKDVGFLAQGTPFFVEYGEDMIVDDLLEPKSFFGKYRLKNK